MTQPEMIYSTWSSKGYIEGCCKACGCRFKVASDEIPNELHAKQTLDQKFRDHEEEKHSGKTEINP